MRHGIRRCAAALLALTLMLGAAMPASAMVYGSIDRYSGKALNLREDSTAVMTVGSMVRLRMAELAYRQIRLLKLKDIRSSRPSVAAVTPNGWVKALRAGKTRITTTAKDDRRYELTLTVIRTDAPTRIWFTANAVAARVGRKLELGPYLDAEPVREVLGNARVLWTSSDMKVALVSSTGVVTPRKPGKATVTAVCGKLKAKIRVKVSN